MKKRKIKLKTGKLSENMEKKGKTEKLSKNMEKKLKTGKLSKKTWRNKVKTG